MDTLSSPEIFFWAFVGSFAWAVVAVDAHYEREECLPNKVRSPAYWINQLALASVAGLLAVALTADSPAHALYVGVSAPMLVTTWRRHGGRRRESH